MLPITKFVLAVVKGMGGPDLEKMIDDTVSWAGEEVGKLMRDVVSSSSSGSAKSEERLISYLETHQDQAIGIFAGLIAGTDPKSTSSESSLESYLQVLNVAVAAAERIDGSLVLHGFVHDDKCLSYWNLNGRGEYTRFRKHPGLDVIMRPQSLEVYILDQAAGSLESLNLAIRRSKDRKLKRELFKHCPRVDSITEFAVGLETGLLETSEAEIAVGAPGLLTLAQSIPLAIRSHQLPANALAQTLASIRTLGSRPDDA